jgi:hypothetical protein
MKVLLPMDSAVAKWPAVRVFGDSRFYLRQGQPVLAPRAPTARLGSLVPGQRAVSRHWRNPGRWPGRAAPIIGAMT